jgi:hypothetical protein
MKQILFLVLIAFVMAGRVQAQPKALRFESKTIEPYMNADGTGVFADLLKSAFAYLPQYQIQVVSGATELSLSKDLKANSIDGAIAVYGKQFSFACLSTPLFRFHTAAISLKSRKLKIESLSI